MIYCSFSCNMQVRLNAKNSCCWCFTCFLCNILCWCKYIMCSTNTNRHNITKIHSLHCHCCDLGSSVDGFQIIGQRCVYMFRFRKWGQYSVCSSGKFILNTHKRIPICSSVNHLARPKSNQQGLLANWHIVINILHHSFVKKECEP